MVQHNSSAIPHSLLVISFYGHDWCLYCYYRGLSWGMLWTLCSSLQFQSAKCIKVYDTICFWCARRVQKPVCSLKVVVFSLQCLFSTRVFLSCRAGFGLPVKQMWTEVVYVCSQTWTCDLLSHCVESHGGLGSTTASQCALEGEAEGLSAVGGRSGER